MTIKILEGDCRERLKELADGSVHCCVTSPPYFGLRDYGHDGQMGLEPTPDEFVAGMVEVFREVRRALRDDGTLWLNIGDSYSRSATKGGSGPNGKNESQWGYGAAQSAKIGSSDGTVGRGDMPGSRSGGLGEKQLLGIPWRLAFALQADGWYLRQEIIWHKPNPMPESVRDRCTKAHEQIFLLSKSPRYYFDAEAIAEPAIYVGLPGQDESGFKNAANYEGKHARETPYGLKPSKPRFGGSKYGDSDDPKHATKSGNEYTANGKRNKRSVWTVPAQPFAEAHFATYPPALIEPCILAGCPVGGTVLDPFFGAGTTGVVADRLGRDCIGVELNPEYAALARRRITNDAGLFAQIEAA